VNRSNDIPPKVFLFASGAEGTPGRIAVKVINHFGDEVMKVFGV